MKFLAIPATVLTAGLIGALFTGQSEAVSPSVENTEYVVDASHTAVIFRVKHFGLAWARGTFNEVSGEVSFDPEAPTEAEVSFVIKTDSIDTNAEQRDNHLRGPDFFLVKQFPELKFESKSVKAGKDGNLLVDGVISWRGHEVETTATLEHTGEGPSPSRRPAHGFHAELMIKRSDFGMEYGLPDLLGDDVYIEIDTEVIEKR